MTTFVTAGTGFLLAVLWFDLMFDTQVIGHNVGVSRPGFRGDGDLTWV